MNKYRVKRTCQFRFGPVPSPSVFIEAGSIVDVKKDMPVPEWFELIPAAVVKASAIAAEEASGSGIEVMSRKEIIAELEKLNVAFNKRANFEDLKGLLIDAREARANNI